MSTLAQQSSGVAAACKFPVSACGVKPLDFAEFVNAFKQTIEFWRSLNVSPELDSQAGI
jgi:hypothetical protein